MRIRDWSSDVCSSDLQVVFFMECLHTHAARAARIGSFEILLQRDRRATLEGLHQPGLEIGRASCRARVCLYVSISVVAGSLKKINNKTTTYIDCKEIKTVKKVFN